MHPDQSDAMAKAWTNKQKRTDGRLAQINYLQVQPHSKTRVKVEDFLPPYMKPRNTINDLMRQGLKQNG